MTTKKALITGITGQDGSYLAELLLKNGYEVFGIARKDSSNYWRISHILDKINILNGDVTDAKFLEGTIQRITPDEVYNLGARSFVGSSFDNPVQITEINALGYLKLLEAIRKNAPDSKLYQASTSELFGNAIQTPQNENTPFSPRNPYGITKLFCHWCTINYRATHGIFACNGIMFNHESPRRGIEYVTRKITDGVAKIAAGKQEKITLGNLDTKRDWGFAGDYVEAMWIMLQQKNPDDFVIATGEMRSVGEFCKLAFEYAGIDDWEKRVEINPAFARLPETNLLCGDCSKAKKILGWKPTVSFKELVKGMVEADMERQKTNKNIL